MAMPPNRTAGNQERHLIAAELSESSVVLADLNGNARLDILMSGWDGSSRRTVLHLDNGDE